MPSDQPQLQDRAPDTPAVADPPGRSIEDELRGVFTELTSEREPELFELPAYGKRLQPKYRVLSSNEQDEIARKVVAQAREGKVKSDEIRFITEIDNVIAACVGFYTEVKGKLVPLEETDPKYEGKPIRWGDERLARMVGLDSEEGEQLLARKIVRGVLGDDRIVAEHTREFIDWQDRKIREVTRDF